MDDVRRSTIGVFENSKCEFLIRKVFEVLDTPIKIAAVHTYQECTRDGSTVILR